jgi:hypothetical protein
MRILNLLTGARWKLAEYEAPVRRHVNVAEECWTGCLAPHLGTELSGT